MGQLISFKVGSVLMPKRFSVICLLPRLGVKPMTCCNVSNIMKYQHYITKLMAQNVTLTNSRLSARSVKEGWKKFKSNIFSRGSRGGSGNSALGTDMSGAQSCNDFEGVSTAPMPPNGNRYSITNQLDTEEVPLS